MKNRLTVIFNKIFIPYFPYLTVFLSSLYVPIDNDMGWHLKYGEYIFQHHAILSTNIYSSTLVGYEWYNTPWINDILMYITFHFFGFVGISVLGALVITGILFLLARAFKLTFWEQAILFPAILWVEVPPFSISYRGQLLSFLFLTVIFYLFRKFEEGKKKILLLTIPLFILWTNTHGQFIEGLGIFSLVSFVYYLKKFLAAKRELKGKMFIEASLTGLLCLLSVAVTLINPFGIKIYDEPVRIFNNPIEQFIAEWKPLAPYTLFWWNFIAWDAIFFSGLIIMKIKGKILDRIHFIIPSLLLFWLAFTGRRYIWTFVIISVPVVRYFISLLEPKQKRLSMIIPSVIFGLVFLWAVFALAPYENIGNMSWERGCLQFWGCSPLSAEFLKKANLPGRMLTFYNWGGWLIWNYPEIKPSIDGRMSLWKDEFGYSPFAEYYAYEWNWRDIDKSTFDVVYMSPNRPVYQKLVGLVSIGKWKAVFLDKTTGSAVFVRNK